jgi:Dienelactone hydrolase and related enzymes
MSQQEYTSRIRRIGRILISSHVVYSHLLCHWNHVSVAILILIYPFQNVQGYLLTHPTTVHRTYSPTTTTTTTTRRILPFVTRSNTPPLTTGMYTSPSRLRVLRAVPDLKDENDDDQDPDMVVDPWDDVTFSRNDLENLTVPQLRQQLRLRGLKISGKKSELIDRLLLGTNDKSASRDNNDNGKERQYVSSKGEGEYEKTSPKSKAQQFAQARGKEFIDVTEYLDEQDKGKDTKTFRVQGGTAESSFTTETSQNEQADDDDDDVEKDEKTEATPETWGSEAKIVDDYEGRSVIVDGLSRTVVEFKGSNKKPVNAYVVASRESLKVYLAGGDRGNDATDLETATKNLQLAKEKASKVPMKLEDEQGEDVDDEEGYYKNILDRDYGDWGKYSMTGAQLSSQEIKGVLLLSDVRGPFCDDMRALADKVAFECQPVVVFAPDLFRGKPWEEDSSNPGYNNQGESYEEWRSLHPEDRVSVDIRAAAAALREQYGVSSVSLFGTCYGGGRALEATARVYPRDTMDDVNGEEGPTHGKCNGLHVSFYDSKTCETMLTITFYIFHQSIPVPPLHGIPHVTTPKLSLENIKTQNTTCNESTQPSWQYLAVRIHSQAQHHKMLTN